MSRPFKEKTKDERVKTYATIIYPHSENTPENWRELIVQTHVNAFLSPLHDKDIYDSGDKKGQTKDPHYHLMMMYENKKSPKAVKSFFDTIGGVGLEFVQSRKGMARYLCHIDNPEKYRYSEEDVTTFGYLDYMTLIETDEDITVTLKEMLHWCVRNNCYTYAQFALYCSEYNSEWFRVLTRSSTYVVKNFLQSLTYYRQHSKELESLSNYNKATGEFNFDYQFDRGGDPSFDAAIEKYDSQLESFEADTASSPFADPQLRLEPDVPDHSSKAILNSILGGDNDE